MEFYLSYSQTQPKPISLLPQICTTTYINIIPPSKLIFTLADKNAANYK